VHGDLKPSSVLVRKEQGRWQVRIIGFGLAGRAEAHTDIDAFGRLCSALLAGTPEGLGRLLADCTSGPTRDFGEVLQRLESLPQIVSAAGDGTHRTIGAAIKAARPGAEVRVRPGVYREGVVLDRDVTLVGDGPPDQVVIESAEADCLFVSTD